MFRLALILFSIVSTTLMGMAVIVVLTLGHDTLMPILIGAAAGLIASIPVSVVLARKLATLR